MADETGVAQSITPTVVQPTFRQICTGVGGFLASQALCIADYHSTRIAVGVGIFSVILFMIPLSSSISGAVQRMRTYQPTFNFQDIVTTIGIVVGIIVAIYTLTLPKPQAPGERWQALNSKQVTAIAEVVKANPGKRVLILRTPLPDAMPLADSFAGIFQQNGWSLVAPPYSSPLPRNYSSPLTGDYFGLNVLAPPSDGVANALSQILPQQLSVDVYRDEQGFNTIEPDRKPVDIVIAIGMKHTPSLLRGSTETVPPSSTSRVLTKGFDYSVS